MSLAGQPVQRDQLPDEGVNEMPEYPLSDQIVDALEIAHRLVYGPENYEDFQAWIGEHAWLDHPDGVSASYPWPTIEVEGDWRGGMSGGPLVDLQGQVVGIISRSLPPDGPLPGIGWAVDRTQIPSNMFAPEIDPINPGWSLGWATFSGGAMTGFFETKEDAEAHRVGTHADEVKAVTHCPKTDSWIET